MKKKFDVVALGEAMIEFNQKKAERPEFLQGFGGDTSNAVIAAQRAGVRTAYLTRLGCDWCGRLLLDLWKREGVDISGVELASQGATGLYFVSHGPAGHEFNYQRKGSAASRMTPAWLPKHVIAHSKWLHVSGISFALSSSACATVFEAIACAKLCGTKVSFDSNIRLKLWSAARARQVIQKAVPQCDLFSPSIEDLRAIFGSKISDDAEQVMRFCYDLGAKKVVLRLGEKGCLVGSSLIAGVRVKAIDATGAGDCFSGNLLARLSLRDSLEDAARYANAAAALAVQGYGAVAPLPTAEQTHKFLAKHSA